MKVAHLLAQLSFSAPAPRDQISSRIIAIPELCDGFALSEENIEKKETTAKNGTLAPFLSIPTDSRGHSFLFYLFHFLFFLLLPPDNTLHTSYAFAMAHMAAVVNRRAFLSNVANLSSSSYLRLTTLKPTAWTRTGLSRSYSRQ